MPQKLNELFLDTLRDIYDAEKQLTRALPKLSRSAVSRELSDALSHHLHETQEQISTLEETFELLGEPARGRHCAGIAGILVEGQAMLDANLEPASHDAGIVAAARRIEHYEMAVYGTLAAWAQSLGYAEVAKRLQGILRQEKFADQKLSALAESGIHPAAWWESEADPALDAAAPARAMENGFR
jgi:ferritin-like metal-binding protein YciE